MATKVSGKSVKKRPPAKKSKKVLISGDDFAEFTLRYILMHEHILSALVTIVSADRDYRPLTDKERKNIRWLASEIKEIQKGVKPLEEIK